MFTQSKDGPMRNSWLKTTMSVIVTFAVLTTGWGCSQMSAEEKKAEHEKRGQSYFAEEKYREAMIEYKNVVQIDPKDAKAHYQLALIHMKLGGMEGKQAVQRQALYSASPLGIDQDLDQRDVADLIQRHGDVVDARVSVAIRGDCGNRAFGRHQETGSHRHAGCARHF